MADCKEASETIADGITEGYEKIEAGVVTGYKQIETGVVEGYRKVEDTVVGSFNKMTDKFVGKFLTRDGETVEDAKNRLSEDQKAREAAQKARIEASLETSRNAGKRH